MHHKRHTWYLNIHMIISKRENWQDGMTLRNLSAEQYIHNSGAICWCTRYLKQYVTVMDLLKEFPGSASVDKAITQQYRTLRFSMCPPLTSHRNSKEGSRDLRVLQWCHKPATRDVSNSGGSCVFPWDLTRGVICGKQPWKVSSWKRPGSVIWNVSL
jgi:hypothetical protein